MTKIKEIKRKKTSKRAKITVRSLIAEIKKKLNSEKIDAVMNLLEDKYRELDSAKKVVLKIEKQIKTIENKDIEEIDTDDYNYDEDEKGYE